IFPTAPARSAARCPPRPPRLAPTWPRSERSPSHCAGIAKETAAGRRSDPRSGALSLATCVRLQLYFLPTTNFGQQSEHYFDRATAGNFGTPWKRTLRLDGLGIKQHYTGNCGKCDGKDGSRSNLELSKNSNTALSSHEGAFETSTTTCAPASAAASPSPVTELMPREGDAATTSWPCCRRLLTSLVPMSPVPPMMTIFILLFLVSEVLVFITRASSFRYGFPCSR